MSRLAIVTTHPIQYNAPLFKLLAAQPGLEVKVFYTLGKEYDQLKDKGFGKTIAWDIPLLNGYDYEFLNNVSEKPGTSHFKGVVNPDVIEAIDTFRPTAILIYGWKFSSHLQVLRHYKSRIPLYFRGDSTLLDEEIDFKMLFRRLVLKQVYKYIDKAFYVGTNNKQYFLKHGVKEQNLLFAPHAIDNKRFASDVPYARESSLIREELGIPEENTVFLFTGKLEQKKNPFLLLKAFKELNQERVSLLFVGNGALEDVLKRDAAGCDDIYFLPFQNQMRMPAVYRSADILVLPSSGPGETWGLCVNEAMASGLPVIVSSKAGCAVDLVKEGLNGYTFEAGSEEGLFKALKSCSLKSKNEVKVMADSSRAIIADWSYDHVSNAITAEILKKSFYH